MICNFYYGWAVSENKTTGVWELSCPQIVPDKFDPVADMMAKRLLKTWVLGEQTKTKAKSRKR